MTYVDIRTQRGASLQNRKVDRARTQLRIFAIFFGKTGGYLNGVIIHAAHCRFELLSGHRLTKFTSHQNTELTDINRLRTVLVVTIKRKTEEVTMLLH